ncbi:MAG: 1,6-anhydro-N-acetylmuramyl-L-alanine amidase AmpD [Gammaproteobacteria bacterium]|jgi:N-acetyl-anhydromuramoyl-L-alanine amidase|nr:1,6-anhydro-N-acetylmuramyl-L-alanine amidase AmpD [Gammaproteobacteria bacterium]MBT4492580.1 1,6-anhydro-N-acetylmuramyl-L-alanine amidase AmpD [Gammaproteobacteria bacterium]MBT7370587.1 1,6-anhydro-N-acetylmuramyl-L-alanine amidase AmpD [Gammaproteobacteria bacterium]
MIGSISRAAIKLRVIDHKLTDAEYLDSPNRDDRPVGEISLIVIHGISLPAGQFGGSEVAELFSGVLDTSRDGLQDLEGLKVSSHLFIRRGGEVIQFVDFDKRAWHAGVSAFRGRQDCNDYAIGIELEGADHLAYEHRQYRQLSRICAVLMNHYGITEVAGHCHIAPGRKTDPGEAFDWAAFKRALAAAL